jgi:hypothetical protein
MNAYPMNAQFMREHFMNAPLRSELGAVERPVPARRRADASYSAASSAKLSATGFMSVISIIVVVVAALFVLAPRLVMAALVIGLPVGILVVKGSGWVPQRPVRRVAVPHRANRSAAFASAPGNPNRITPRGAADWRVPLSVGALGALMLALAQVMPEGIGGIFGAVGFGGLVALRLGMMLFRGNDARSAPRSEHARDTRRRSRPDPRMRSQGLAA